MTMIAAVVDTTAIGMNGGIAIMIAMTVTIGTTVMIATTGIIDMTGTIDTTGTIATRSTITGSHIAITGIRAPAITDIILMNLIITIAPITLTVTAIITTAMDAVRMSASLFGSERRA